MENIFYSSSKEKTRTLGKILCKRLLPGDIIFLLGDLGAGKSEFVRGIAEGLNIKDPIPSPSFTILNVYYNGAIPLNHFDWYRIVSDEELFEIGTDDFLFSDSRDASRRRFLPCKVPSRNGSSCDDSYRRDKRVPKLALNPRRKIRGRNRQRSFRGCFLLLK